MIFVLFYVFDHALNPMLGRELEEGYRRAVVGVEAIRRQACIEPLLQQSGFRYGAPGSGGFRAPPTSLLRDRFSPKSFPAGIRPEGVAGGSRQYALWRQGRGRCWTLGVLVEAGDRLFDIIILALLGYFGLEIITEWRMQQEGTTSFLW